MDKALAEASPEQKVMPKVPWALVPLAAVWCGTVPGWMLMATGWFWFCLLLSGSVPASSACW